MDRSRAGEPPPAAARSGVPTGLVVAGLCVVLLISIVLAIGLGPATIAPAETLRYLVAAITGGTIEAGEVSAYQIIWQIRTPRVLLAALVGAGLGAVGVAIQTLVRNPLADPYVLGVSSGASAGAVAVGTLGLLGGLGLYALSVGAFAGAGIASVLVFLAARTRLGLQPLRLVLTGVTLSFGFQAVMSVIIYLAPNSESTARRPLLDDGQLRRRQLGLAAGPRGDADHRIDHAAPARPDPRPDGPG